MKSINFSFVETNLTKKDYVQMMVELVSQYPARDGKKTFEYCFKKQNPSKISIPVELLDKLQFMQDETTSKLYLVLDGTIVERVVENGFKRVQLTAAYAPADAKKQEAIE